MQQYMVIKTWTAAYPDPIVLAAGQQVLIDHARKEENPDWQGWVWCRSRDNEGWVPEQILQIVSQNGQTALAQVKDDYSARELAVIAGDIVAGDSIANGWLWCRKEGGGECGWVPLENLSRIAIAGNGSC